MVATAGATDARPPETTSRTPRVFRPRRLPGSDAAFTNALETWSGQIETILAARSTDAEIANKLLEAYPSAPAEGQADLALEIAARISNENYGKLASLMTNSTTPGEVVETLLTDLLDRPDKIRLPLLLDMARATENPKAEDARDLLEALLGENFGSDWEGWSKKISEWLASHPE